MPSKGADVVVIGGGVVGLSLAWRLAQAGTSVAVIDAGCDDGQASVASAGMLAPLAESEKEGPLVHLGLDSLRRYPGFVSELREESGVALGLSGPGTLRVAEDQAEEEALASAFARQKTAGLPLDWLDAQAVQSLEPALTDRVRAAVLSPEEKHIEPGALLAALAAACHRRNVRLEPGRAVGFEVQGRCVASVETSAGSWSGARAVIAAGAWSASLARRLGVELPLFPVRGQLLALRCPYPLLRHTIYSHAGYLVPRTEGRLIVGATVERVGFDPSTTDAGQAVLLTSARRLAPPLGTIPVESRWAGLRPGSGDGLPVLGPLPGWENVCIATGHFRNGILLAPVTADMMSRFILGGAIEPALEPFLADRWAETPAS